MLQSNSQMFHSQLEAGIERKEKKTVNITLKNIVSPNQFQHIVWIYLYCNVMTVNIWKSYMWTAVEETNMEAILAVINTTYFHYHLSIVHDCEDRFQIYIRKTFNPQTVLSYK